MPLLSVVVPRLRLPWFLLRCLSLPPWCPSLLLRWLMWCLSPPPGFLSLSLPPWCPSLPPWCPSLSLRLLLWPMWFLLRLPWFLSLSLPRLLVQTRLYVRPLCLETPSQLFAPKLLLPRRLNRVGSGSLFGT